MRCVTQGDYLIKRLPDEDYFLGYRQGIPIWQPTIPAQGFATYADATLAYASLRIVLWARADPSVPIITSRRKQCQGPTGRKEHLDAGI